MIEQGGFRSFCLRAIMPTVLWLLCAACTGSEAAPVNQNVSAAPPAYGDTLVEGTIGEASTLLPILASDSASHSVAGLIYNGLIKYDKNLKIVGDLAETYLVSPDGLAITFKLRRNVTWHDGKPFTSRDVLYTYRVIIDPKTPTA